MSGRRRTRRGSCGRPTLRSTRSVAGVGEHDDEVRPSGVSSRLKNISWSRRTGPATRRPSKLPPADIHFNGGAGNGPLRREPPAVAARDRGADGPGRPSSRAGAATRPLSASASPGNPPISSRPKLAAGYECEAIELGAAPGTPEIASPRGQGVRVHDGDHTVVLPDRRRRPSELSAARPNPAARGEARPGRRAGAERATRRRVPKRSQRNIEPSRPAV